MVSYIPVVHLYGGILFASRTSLALRVSVIIGLPDSTMTQDFSLTCYGDDIVYSQVTSIKWLHRTNYSTPLPLGVDAHPELRADGIDLRFRNATSDNEGIYYCQAKHADGRLSQPQGVGCIYVAGKCVIPCAL